MRKWFWHSGWSYEGRDAGARGPAPIHFFLLPCYLCLRSTGQRSEGKQRPTDLIPRKWVATSSCLWEKEDNMERHDSQRKREGTPGHSSQWELGVADKQRHWQEGSWKPVAGLAGQLKLGWLEEKPGLRDPLVSSSTTFGFFFLKEASWGCPLAWGTWWVSLKPQRAVNADFALITGRKWAILKAIKFEGTRDLLAKPIPRLSNSLGTEGRECLGQFPVIQLVEPGPLWGLTLRKQTHKRKGQEGGNTS